VNAEPAPYRRNGVDDTSGKGIVGRTFVIALDEASRRHLLDAIHRHASWVRERGFPLPPALAALAVQLAAQAGQQRPQGDDDAIDDDDRDREFLNYTSAGRVLGVSDRTVRRLVRDGRLKSARIGGRRLIPRQALADFVKDIA
jgi:excisionase family DNA binding protein